MDTTSNKPETRYSPYVTCTEAAAILNVSRCTLYRLIKRGTLPTEVIGLGQRGVHRILISDLALCFKPKPEGGK